MVAERVRNFKNGLNGGVCTIGREESAEDLGLGFDHSGELSLGNTLEGASTIESPNQLIRCVDFCASLSIGSGKLWVRHLLFEEAIEAGLSSPPLCHCMTS